MLTPLKIYSKTAWSSYASEEASESTRDYLIKAVMNLDIPFSHDIDMTVRERTVHVVGHILEQNRDEIKKVEQYAYAKWAKGDYDANTT